MSELLKMWLEILHASPQEYGPIMSESYRIELDAGKYVVVRVREYPDRLERRVYGSYRTLDQARYRLRQVVTSAPPPEVAA